MRTRRNRLFSFMMAICLLLQLPTSVVALDTGISSDMTSIVQEPGDKPQDFIPQPMGEPVPDNASAVPDNITGQSAYLVVHEPNSTAYPSRGGASILSVTCPEGNPIDAVNNTYSDVPVGATLQLRYVFHLEDGDEDQGIDYDYSENNYFDIELPGGITFDQSTGNEIYAIDSNNPGERWLLGTWDFTDDNTVRVFLSDQVAHHRSRWGELEVEGTFDEVAAGEEPSSSMLLGSQEYTFIREVPPPPRIEMQKSGEYDAATNRITWTVTIAPPGEDLLQNYTLIDEYSNNQSYVPGSFKVNGGGVDDGDLDLTGTNAISYIFPEGTVGTQTVVYQTAPRSFSGQGNEAFENEATLKRGNETVTDPASDTVQLGNWIEKSGALVDTEDDSIVIRWEVAITIPEDGVITGAEIADQIPPGLKLQESSVQIVINGAAAQTVSKGTGAGTYSYQYTNQESSSNFTYRFPVADGVDGKLAGTAKLVYSTELTDRDLFLNNNGTVPFANTANFSWNEMPGATPPSHTASVDVVNDGGLLAKSAGSTTNYAHPGFIRWNITVNANRITLASGVVEDTIPAGQRLAISVQHPFTVHRNGTQLLRITDAAAAPGDLVLSNGADEGFVYTLPETSTINTYTVEYYTEIIDTNAGANNDTSGLDTLYRNADVSFTNEAVLKRTGADVPASATQTYQSRVIQKSVATQFNYHDHTIQWSIVVNRNNLPMTDLTLTDAIQTAGMKLLIDDDHPFVIRRNSDNAVIASQPTTITVGDLGFTYDFGNIDTRHTVTFYTKVTDQALLTKWAGNKNFSNSASITADELPNPVSDSASAGVKNPVVTKGTVGYSNGDDHINWSVVINPAGIPLHGATVTDQLNEGLELDTASVKLYKVPVSATNGEASSSAAGTLVTEGYTVHLPTPENGNTLAVDLPDSSDTYRLEFTTFILPDNLSFTNSVTLTGTPESPGGAASAQHISIQNLWSSGGSGSQTLVVNKTDGQGNPIVGAQYQLLNFKMQPVIRNGSPMVATTNIDGDAIFNNLPSWVFFAKETNPPAGYLINPEAFGGERPSGTLTLPTTNALGFGDVSFKKETADGTAVSGGVFTLSGTSDLGETVLRTAGSVAGVVTFENVPMGQYVVRETQAPQGYLPTDDTLTVTVGYNADKTDTAVSVTPDTLINSPVPVGSVELMKTNSSHKPLAGAVFGLYDQSNQLVQSATSQQDGKVTFINVPLGSYTIREITPPSGYKLTDAVLTANVIQPLALVQAEPYTVINYRIPRRGDFSWTNKDKDDKPESKNDEKLPQAGGLWDASLLGMLGAGMLAAGAGLAVQRKIRRKRG